MSQVPSLEMTTPVRDERCVIADAVEDAAPVTVPERFVIDDAEKASWAVRKIVEARAYAARVRQWAEQELRRAEHDEQWLLRRFGGELEAWLRAELSRDGGRRRSVNLPAGRIGLRAQPPRLEVTDEVALIQWCHANLPAALKVSVEAQGNPALELLAWQRQHLGDAQVEQRVEREAVGRYCLESGEVAPGTTMRPVTDQFYVR